MPDSRVDTIIDRLRNARSTGIDHRGEVRVPLAVAVAAVHAAAGLGSPDERLREAGERLAQAVARVCGEGHPALGMWRVALGTDARGKPGAGWSPGIDDPEPPELGDIETGEGWYQT